MLHCVTGQMFASKSFTLIEYANKFKNEGVKYRVFYPASINKEEGYIYSRKNNSKIKAVKIYNIDDLYNNVQDIDVILIDEYTFICSNSQISEFMKFLDWCDEHKKDVYLFGISLDYLGRPFDIAMSVLPYADTHTVLHATCDICGKDASRQIRYINGVLDVSDETEVLQMENTDVVYKPICTECYRKLTGLNPIK